MPPTTRKPTPLFLALSALSIGLGFMAWAYFTTVLLFYVKFSAWGELWFGTAVSMALGMPVIQLGTGLLFRRLNLLHSLKRYVLIGSIALFLAGILPLVVMQITGPGTLLLQGIGGISYFNLYYMSFGLLIGLTQAQLLQLSPLKQVLHTLAWTLAWLAMAYLKVEIMSWLVSHPPYNKIFWVSGLVPGLNLLQGLLVGFVLSVVLWQVLKKQH